MTNRNRRFRGRGSPRRNHRLVWVNTNVNMLLTPLGKDVTNLLAPAVPFMLFDSTVLSIVIAGLTYSYDTVDPSGNRHLAVVFFVGSENLDTDDMTNPLTDNIGPGWMGTLWTSQRDVGIQSVTQQVVAPEGKTFKSQRRFRENNQTLWMLTQNYAPHANDTAQNVDGMIRVLLRVP